MPTKVVPLNEPVIVPAVKLPEASLATIADAVFALVAVVAELLTFKAVAMVSSFVSAMAADAFMSALTITPLAIAVTPVLLMVISPDTEVLVATFALLPSTMLPLVSVASLLYAIAAADAISALTNG